MSGPPRLPTSAARRLLVLAYHFPPSAEVAGKPTARLVRHLPAFGWHPVVVTIPDTSVFGPLDPAAYTDVVDGTRIEKVAPWPWTTDGLRAVVRLLRRGQRAVAVGPRAAGPTGRRPGTAAVYDRLRHYLNYPDPQAGWVGPVVRRATRLLRRERFDAVLTVAPPHSASLAGWALHRRFRHVPWVAQLHDPWVGNPFHESDDRLQARCTVFLEQLVVRTADAVCMATDEAAAAVAARYPAVPVGRFHVLHNGYDPADFPPAPTGPGATAGPVRFVHAGSLYGHRDPLPFVRALANLVARGQVGPAGVRVEFIGDIEPRKAEAVRREVADRGLGDVVTLCRPIPYAEALDRLAAADVLLLFAQGQPDQVPAKVYEYLHLNRFVLSFTDGATARILREAGAGRVVGPGDDVDAVLADVVGRHRAGRLAGLAGPARCLDRYQARPLAGELAAILDRLAIRPGRARTRPVPCGSAP